MLELQEGQWRREVDCVETVERGRGRHSQVKYVGIMDNGSWHYQVTVSQPIEIERLPRCLVGVVVQIERVSMINLAHRAGESPPPPHPNQIKAT